MPISVRSDASMSRQQFTPIFFNKIVFVTAEGFWRWKLFDYLYNENNNNFDEFFSKLTQYLVLQEDKSRFRIDYERQYTEQEDIKY